MDSMIGRTVSAKRSASLGETARPLAEASRICRIAKPWAAGFAGGEGGLGAVAKKFNRSRCRPWVTGGNSIVRSSFCARALRW